LFQFQDLAFQLHDFGGQARSFRFERLFLLAGAGTKLPNALVQAQQDSQHQNKIGDYGQVGK
jgi:hypothetical protein